MFTICINKDKSISVYYKEFSIDENFNNISDVLKFLNDAGVLIYKDFSLN